jgi:hypothetical protein
VRVVEVFSLNAKVQSRPDLLLLLFLLLAILLTPVLNQDNWRRLVLVAVTFIPIVLSIVRLSQIKRWVWPSVLLALGNAVFVVAGNTFPSPTLTGIRWAFLASFFGITAAGLFSYLRNSRSVAQAELYTAVNIYLLLGLLWAAIYLAIDAFSPGSIQMGSHSADVGEENRQRHEASFWRPFRSMMKASPLSATRSSTSPGRFRSSVIDNNPKSRGI